MNFIKTTILGGRQDPILINTEFIKCVEVNGGRNEYSKIILRDGQEISVFENLSDLYKTLNN